VEGGVKETNNYQQLGKHGKEKLVTTFLN